MDYRILSIILGVLLIASVVENFIHMKKIEHLRDADIIDDIDSQGRWADEQEEEDEGNQNGKLLYL